MARFSLDKKVPAGPKGHEEKYQVAGIRIYLNPEGNEEYSVEIENDQGHSIKTFNHLPKSAFPLTISGSVALERADGIPLK